MTFISFAQNAEDVILYRALRHVENGFYIDIGAQDPVTDSVTRAFYDRGWHGINVEPVPRWFKRLEEDRPRDVNIQAIVADARGVETIREVDGTGLSTVDEAIAEQHLREGHVIREFEVRQLTLDDICREHGVTTIHFLKVDVEGHEAKVLAGAAFQEFRPWIALVEATAPNSQVETHHAWEPRLLAHNYTFVYADGLNRFYVANEKLDDLKDAFRYPPNFFDDYERMAVNWLRQHAQRLQSELDEAERGLDRWLLRGAATPGDEHEMLLALRARYRRSRADCRVLQHQARVQEAELNRLQGERGELAEAGRSVRRYRMQLFAAEAKLVEKTTRLEAKDKEVAELAERVSTLSAHAQWLEEHRLAGLAEAHEWKAQLDSILLSSSWRITRPLRVARRMLSNPQAHGGRLHLAKRVSGASLRVAARLPGARRLAAAVLRRLPSVRQRLLDLRDLDANASPAPGVTPGPATALSPAAMLYSQALDSASRRTGKPTEGVR
ncbi:FkbM family methyltransferase [Luteibacter yeojuensis]|uniref:FkbM family methyltransferase n=1 Tax=Luteibacter yeojuensis TaxID=345309 RepID=UPI0006962C78|nr:FkbM family methyltransferase [Luteibacter yeojuensis]